MFSVPNSGVRPDGPKTRRGLCQRPAHPPNMTPEFYLIAGLIYFLINYAIERAAKAVERRVALPS